MTSRHEALPEADGLVGVADESGSRGPGGAPRATVGRTALDPVSRSYLCDVAAHPYSPALERDNRLGLNRAQGVRIRRRLAERGFVAEHRVSSGRRAGRLLLLRLTPGGAAHVAAGGRSVEAVSADEFLRRFRAQQPPDKPSSPRGAARTHPRRAKSRTPLFRECVRAYMHLHDLDYLQASPLVELEIVRERMNRLSAMAEARALRGMLIEAATLAARDAIDMPTQAPLRHFLEQYLEGKLVTEIAAELGVTREWCSRAYRKQALELAAMQCERLMVIAASTAAHAPRRAT